MRYSADHKAETRRRLIETGGALAKKSGFATTGVDGLMASVGLTGGAFYSHFSSKDELLNEIIGRELSVSHEKLRHHTQGALNGLPNFLADYLDRKHLQYPEQGCALPSLSAEVARADTNTKQTYETSVTAIQQTLARNLDDDSAAWAMLAMSVGAIVIAKAMATPETQQQVLDACKQFSDGNFNAAALTKTVTAPKH